MFDFSPKNILVQTKGATQQLDFPTEFADAVSGCLHGEDKQPPMQGEVQQPEHESNAPVG